MGGCGWEGEGWRRNKKRRRRQSDGRWQQDCSKASAADRADWVPDRGGRGNDDGMNTEDQ